MKKLIITLSILFIGITAYGQNPLIQAIASQNVPAAVGCTPDSNYGNTTNTNASGTLGANRLFCVPITMAVGGNICSVSLYIGSTAASHSKIAIYTGTPTYTLLANGVSDEVVQSANSWNVYNFSISPTVTATTYYVVVFTDSDCKIDSNNPVGEFAIMYKDGNTYPNFPSTTTLGSWDNFDVGIYVSVDN